MEAMETTGSIDVRGAEGSRIGASHFASFKQGPILNIWAQRPGGAFLVRLMPTKAQAEQIAEACDAFIDDCNRTRKETK